MSPEPPSEATEGVWRSAAEHLGQHPTSVNDQLDFVFRVSSDPEVTLEFLDGGGGWVQTKQFGDLIINRVTLGGSSMITMQIKGSTKEGELVKISGWYEMNGQTVSFGPGPLGSRVDVDVSHNLSCSNPLEYLSFTVVARPDGEDPYIYDPTILLAPKGGQCNENN